MAEKIKPIEAQKRFLSKIRANTQKKKTFLAASQSLFHNTLFVIPDLNVCQEFSST